MLNRVQIIGNLAADPEVRAVGDGSVANIRVGVSESWIDKRSGEKRERTEWVNCTIWGGLADVLKRLAPRKGDRVYVEGKLTTRKWQDKEGKDRYTTEVVAQGYDGKVVLMSARRAAQESFEPQEPQTGIDIALNDEIPF